MHYIFNRYSDQGESAREDFERKHIYFFLFFFFFFIHIFESVLQKARFLSAKDLSSSASKSNLLANFFFTSKKGLNARQKLKYYRIRT